VPFRRSRPLARPGQHNTWIGLHKHGSLANDGAFQLSPWSALFLEQWVVSWAALQAFILISADTLSAAAVVASNVSFVGFGLVGLAAHVTFIVLAAKNGRDLWK